MSALNGRKRLLIVDDNPRDSYLLQQLFQGHGFDVDVADEGKSALEKAGLHPPDLIISDVFMPGMDGFALCRAWRQDEQLRHIPFLFYTATYTTSDDETFALEIGADGFLVKPEEPHTLLARVENLLEEAANLQRPSAQADPSFQEAHAAIIGRKLEEKVAELEAANRRLMDSQTELRESEERFRMLVEQAADAFFVHDFNGHFIDVNEQACISLGYTRQELLHMTVMDVDVTYDLGRATEVWTTLQPGETRTITGTHRHRDGSLFPVEIRIRLMILSGTRLIHALARDVSERVRAEKELRESTNRQEALLAAIPDIVVEVDTEKIYRWANGPALAFFGAAMIGHEAAEFFAGPQDTYAAVDPLFRGQQDSSYVESWQIRQDGEKRLLAWWCKTMRGQNGEILGVLSTARDITEQRRTETALSLSEARYRSLLETSFDWVWEVDTLGVYTFASSQVQQILGYRPEDLLGKTPFDFMPPAEAERVRAIFEDLAARRLHFNTLENTNIHRSGSEIVVETSGVPIFSPDGTWLGYRGFDRDITERKRAERALARESRKNLAFLRSASDGVMILDPEKRIIEVSFSACEMLGYSREELIGMHLSEWDASPDPLDLMHRVDNELTENGRARFETKHRRKDGSLIDVEVTAYLLEMDGARIVYSAARDITERHRAEKALAEANRQFKNLFENMLNSYAHCRMIYEGGTAIDYEYLSVNPAFVRITGLPVTPGHRISEFIPNYASHNAASLTVFDRVTKTGVPERFVHFLAAVGKWFDMTVYRPAPGEFIVMTEDITERRRVEEALQNRQMLLNRMSSLARVGGWALDINGMRGTWTDEVERICELDPSAFHTLQEALALFRGEDRKRLEQGLRCAVDDGRSLDIELEIYPPGGGHKWIRLQTLPVMKEGRVIRLEGAIQDITERKQFEQDLRLRSSALQAAANAIMITDREGKIEWVNAAFTHLTGYTPDEVIGHNPRDLIKSGAQPLDTYRELWEKVLAGDVWHGELINRRKNGSTYIEDQTITPVRDEHGAIAHFVAIKQDITARKQSTADLAAERSRLRALIDTIPDLVWLKDPEGRYLLCNHSFESLCGIEETALIGKTDDAFRPPDVANAMRSQDVRAIERGGPVTTEEDFIFANDGHHAMVETVRTPILDAEGKLQGILGVARDVTDRIRAAHSLAESEERLATIFELSPIGIAIGLLPEGTFVDVNDAWARMMGFQKDEIIGRTGLDLAIWADTESRNDVFRTLGRYGTLRNTDVILRRKTGDIFEGSISGRTIELQGRLHVVMTLTDVTLQNEARRTLEAHGEALEALVAERTQELRQQARSLRAVIDNIPHLVWMKDRQGRFLALNRQIADAIGRPMSELLGKTDDDVWPGEQAERYRADDEEVMTRRQGKTIVEPLANVPGSLFETSKTPVFDEDGTVLGTVGFSRDVSEQQALEMARERARREAERLASTKSEFLANMSHEIRTPLNAVLGVAQMGFRNSPPGRARTAFGHILDSGRLLLGIINDILDFSKLEAGRLRIDAVPVSPARIVDEAATLMQASAQSRGIVLNVSKAQDLPRFCRSDPVRLSQILLNLLSNAIKFTSEGSVDLEASREGDWLVLSVSDSGIGMTPSELEQIFRPFEQADSSTTRRFGGTGLGLTITKRFVEMMGGEMSVRSSPGAGSQFIVRLPIVETENDAPAFVGVPLSDQGIQRLQGLHVLVAEDNEVNRIVLEELLSLEGATISIAEDGRAAVEMVASNPASNPPFDVVLMDIQMPEMDGYEATRKIHEMLPHLPVIGQTAHAMPEEKERCLAAGMVDHIPKPIDLDHLVTTVRQHSLRKPEPSKQTAYPAWADESAQLIDWPSLEARYKGKPDFLDRLLSVTASSQAPIPGLLRDAGQKKDFQKLASLCHTLKGMAGNIMAASLADQARDTETASRSSSENAASMASYLADSVERLIREIEDHIKNAQDGAGEAFRTGPGEA